MDRSVSRVRCITVTGVCAAVAVVLQFLEFPLPFVPAFLKFDFSDLPALLASFALGPVWGVTVELIKNLIHWPLGSTGGVGELANFLIGALLVFPAGLCYRLRPSRGSALLGSAIGTVTAAAVSVPVNYFITYPFYTHFMPMEAILDAYRLLFPAADTLLKALLLVNLPFTFIKGLICLLLTFLIYKKLSPLLRGQNNA